MSNRQTTILSHLQSNSRASIYYLACLLDAPEASVRRDVQSLRKQGHTINFDPTSGQLVYHPVA